MTTKTKVSVLTGLVAVFAIASMMFAFLPEAAASHNAEPTMWVNGINSGQTHSYIYSVTAPNLDMSVALLIKDMQEKQNVTLWTTDPAGVVTVCPTATVTVGGGPTNLLVAECYFSPPAVGIWTISITAGAITNNPVGYAIAADTTHT